MGGIVMGVLFLIVLAILYWPVALALFAIIVGVIIYQNRGILFKKKDRQVQQPTTDQTPKVTIVPNPMTIKYSPVSLEKKSTIVSIFNKKWLTETYNKFIVVDIETTGLDRATDYIVEISAIKYVNGIEIKTFTTLVKPDIHIPDYVVSIHGIDDDAVKNAPQIEDVMPVLLDFLGDSILVAHNAHFDIGFIEVWARRCGYDPKWNYVDTISVAKKFMPGLENYKQKTILDAMGYVQDTYHRAEDDCRGCAEILLTAINSIINDP